MTELERVQDVEVLDPNVPTLQDHVSEWMEGARQELIGQFRQARAAASVVKHHGRGSMKAFASEVGCSKSKVYDYARVWWAFSHVFEDGMESGRLESLSFTHFVKAINAPDPVAVLEEAEDEGLSTRQLEDRIKEREQPNAEVGATEPCPTCKDCPTCGGSHRVFTGTGEAA